MRTLGAPLTTRTPMTTDTVSLATVALFDDAPPIELLRAAFGAHRFTPHAHAELSIAVIDGGAVRTRLGDSTVTATAGSIVVVPPGLVHTGEPAAPGGYRYSVVRIPRATLSILAEFDGWNIAVPRPVVRDSLLAARLTRVYGLLEGGATHGFARVLLRDVIGGLMARGVIVTEKSPAPTREDPLVRAVREYLEANCTRVVTLAELARLTGFSQFHVSRVFRDAVGVPPYAYLGLARLERARELIARGEPLSTVAYATGFSDQSHLTRHFKRVFGVPPGQYAREAVRTERPAADDAEPVPRSRSA